MKIFSYAVLLSLLFFTSCKKNSDSDNGGGGPIDYSGNYKGTITVTENGSVTQTIFNGVIIAVNNGNRQQLTLVNNYISSSSVALSGNIWTLAKATAVSTPSYNLVEYGTGTFGEGTMTFELYQEKQNTGSNSVISTTKWAGFLYRQ